MQIILAAKFDPHALDLSSHMLRRKLTKVRLTFVYPLVLGCVMLLYFNDVSNIRHKIV